MKYSIWYPALLGIHADYKDFSVLLTFSLFNKGFMKIYFNF